MSFNRKIIRALDERYHQDYLFSKRDIHSPDTSAVLFLLGPQPDKKGFLSDPCLILTKRSAKVKQPGDLCCPGGSISTRFDTFLAKLLYLPGTPLTRWPCWPEWHKQRSLEMRNLALFLAASLRESFEEIRLNPFGLKFLGPLASQQLVMFKKVIYPLVCRISYQKRFYLNWEVDKIVFIPLKKLLNPSNYARYRVRVNPPDNTASHLHINDYPCFIHNEQDGSEVLWGATFRIVADFLDIVFGFKFPDIESLPVIFGTLGENYLTGSG
jgi:hypothetical protein